MWLLPKFPNESPRPPRRTLGLPCVVEMGSERPQDLTRLGLLVSCFLIKWPGKPRLAVDPPAKSEELFVGLVETPLISRKVKV